MKTKILLIGWDHCLENTMLRNELKGLYETFSLKFAQSDVEALDEIAYARIEKKEPFNGLVFARNFVDTHAKESTLIHDFSQRYATILSRSLVMISSDQDPVRGKALFTTDFVPENDWERVKDLFSSRFKGFLRPDIIRFFI